MVELDKKEYDSHLFDMRNSREKVNRFNEVTELLNDMNYLIGRLEHFAPLASTAHTFTRVL